MPVIPPPSTWVFPSVSTADEEGVVGVGADLDPGTVLGAYCHGLFPMPVGQESVIAWWSPDPRGVIELADLRITRSMRQAAKRFDVRIDTSFDTVIEQCRSQARPGGWISDDIVASYIRLHRMGWAHSIETWQNGKLVGGLYGIAIGGLFAGESMFHTVTDASKVALMHLADVINDGRDRLIDTQWFTEHLGTLGATEITRPAYLNRLQAVLQTPLPSQWDT